jgi:hypothetical protein
MHKEEPVGASSRYLKVGFLLDAFILGIAGMLSMIFAFFAYDGKCSNRGFMGGSRYPCSLSEFMLGMIIDLAFILLLYLWWLIIPLLLLPPSIGWWIDQSKKKLKDDS